VAFHASYDWVLYRALRDAARGRATAEGVSAALRSWARSFPRDAVPLRFLENHDEPRAAEVFGDRLPAFAATAFLSGGWPLLYAGQEVGAAHRPSLFEADPVDWSTAAPGATGLHRGLLRLRGRAPWGPGAAHLVDTDRPREAVALLRAERGARGLVVANLGRRRRDVRAVLPEGTAFHRIPEAGAAAPAALVAGEAVALEPGAFWIGEAS
jgi:hypothetical protein